MITKRKITAFIIFICLLCVTGCGRHIGDDTEASGIADADSRYKEYEISRLNNNKDIGIFAFKQYNDVLTIICNDEKANICIYKSQDNGLNWEQSEDLENVSSAISDSFIDAADINEKGEYAFSVMRDMTTSSNSEIVIIDDTGNKNTFTLGENAKNVRFSKDGTNILVDTGSSVMSYDRNGTLSVTYPVPGCIDFCEASDGSIVFLTTTALYKYSKKGELTDTDTLLSDNLLDELTEFQSTTNGTIGVYNGALKIDNEDNLYIMLSSGIYRHRLGSNLIEHIVDKVGTSFVGGRKGMCDFLLTGEDFYVLLSKGAVLRYTTADADKVVTNVEKETVAQLKDAALTIYSLYPSEMLDQVVGLFTAKYPNVEVRIEIGIEEESGISVNDAVKALNAKLLSAEGPDVMVLTGLDVDTYADNGILMELSAVHDAVKDSHPDMFLNILDAYRREDGTIYALPARFSAPVAVAQKDVLPAIKDAASIVELIDTGKDYPLGNALEIYYADELYDTFYPVYADKIFNAAGDYNPDELKTFMEDMKQIWEILRKQTTAAEQESVDEQLPVCKNNLSYKTGNLFDRTKSEQDIAITQFLFPIQYFNLITLMNEVDDSYAFESFSYDGNHIFQSKFTVGINSQTKYSEAAQCFVEELFEDDAQGIYAEEGEALNIEPELEIYEGMGMVGENHNITFTFPTDELKDYVMDFFKGLDTPVTVNPIIREIVLTDFESYLNGDISMDDYMNSINTSIKLYMSE
ncbi:MAG: ABC transporter substrate-binding protein [Lachnospiraceae bacterium]|nr:ABC transporter substrate-binding protein [Lachnospiraceae bacterium]